MSFAHVCLSLHDLCEIVHHVPVKASHQALDPIDSFTPKDCRPYTKGLFPSSLAMGGPAVTSKGEETVGDPVKAPQNLLPTKFLSQEELVQRYPFEVRHWVAYISAVENSPPGFRFSIHERAVAALPGSYKLWRLYAKSLRQDISKFHPLHPAHEVSLQVSLRAARALRASPRLWIDVLEQLSEGCHFRRMREIIDEALRNLPITQHDRIWELILERLIPAVPALVRVSLLKRYTRLRPGIGTELVYNALKDAEKWDEAVKLAVRVLKGGAWGEDAKKTKEMLWIDIAEISSEHSEAVKSVDVPQLLREGIRDAKADIAEMWIVLGKYYIRRELFDEAVKTYEEALGSVETVRDFALIFDALSQLEELLVENAITDVDDLKSELEEEEEKEEKDNEAIEDLKQELKQAQETLDARMKRLESLADRRPMLLSDVWLRQNPHNVHEWHKRARLYKKAGDPEGVIETYARALKSVDPHRASNGRPHTLWLAFAQFYESAEDLRSARRILDKAVSNPDKFRAAEDLAAIWCEYGEMELRQNNPEGALEVLKKASTQPEEDRKRMQKAQGNLEGRHDAQLMRSAAAIKLAQKDGGQVHSAAWSAWKSNRIWSFLADLVESIRSPTEAISVYHRMLDLEIATAQNVMNGTSFLQSKRLFEQAFRLFDRGTSVIAWPEALNIWIAYLTAFSKRYGELKLERARDLFEEAIKAAPSYRKYGRDYPHPELPLLYTMYADMEEKYSLGRRAMTVLARGALAVSPRDRADMYRLYIMRMSSLFGVTKTRPIYEEALKNLTTKEEVMEFAQRFAVMERHLGEIDRARAIYSHGAQVADPRGGPIPDAYWKSWHDFELAYGSEDTFRDMLRVKRSVLMHHTSFNLVTPLAVGAGTVEAAASQVVEELDLGVSKNVDEAPAVSQEETGGAMSALEKRVQQTANVANLPGSETETPLRIINRSEEINLDLDDGSTDDESGNGEEHVDDINAVKEKQMAVATGATVASGGSAEGDIGGKGLQREDTTSESDSEMELSKGIRQSLAAPGTGTRFPQVSEQPERVPAEPSKPRIGALERIKRLKS